jgi:hypothetical protein
MNGEQRDESAPVKKTELHERMILGAPLVIWFFGASIVFIVILYFWKSFHSPEPVSVDQAITFFTICSQISAAFAGFLIVGVLFLISRRNFTFRAKGWYWLYLDILALGGAIIILVFNTFLSLFSILDAIEQEEVSQSLVNNLAWTSLLARLSFILIVIGLSFTIGYFKGEADRASENLERQEEGTDSSQIDSQ